MSKYTDKILTDAIKTTEAKQRNSDQDMTMSMDLDITAPEIDEDASAPDGYEDVFNDSSDVKDHDSDDIEDEIIDETDAPETITELRSKERSKKKKKGFFSQSEPEEEESGQELPRQKVVYTSVEQYEDTQPMQADASNPSEPVTEDKHSVIDTFIEESYGKVSSVYSEEMSQPAASDVMIPTEPVAADTSSIIDDPAYEKHEPEREISEAKTQTTNMSGDYSEPVSADTSSIIDTFIDEPTFEEAMIAEKITTEQVIAKNEEIYQQIETQKTTEEVIDHVVSHSNEMEVIEEPDAPLVGVYEQNGSVSVSNTPNESAPEAVPAVNPVEKLVQAPFANDFEEPEQEKNEAVSSIYNASPNEQAPSPHALDTHAESAEDLSDAIERIIINDEQAKSSFEHIAYHGAADAEKSYFEHSQVNASVSVAETVSSETPDNIIDAVIDETPAFKEIIDPDEISHEQIVAAEPAVSVEVAAVPAPSEVIDLSNPEIVEKIAHAYADHEDYLHTAIESHIAIINDALLDDDINAIIHNPASTEKVLQVLSDDISALSQTNDAIIAEIATKYDVSTEEMKTIILSFADSASERVSMPISRQEESSLNDPVPVPNDISATVAGPGANDASITTSHIDHSAVSEKNDIDPISSERILILPNNITVPVSVVETILMNEQRIEALSTAKEDTLFRGFLSAENAPVLKQAIIDTQNTELPSTYRLTYLRDERETKTLLNAFTVRNVISSEYAERVMRDLEELTATKTALGRIKSGGATRADYDTALGFSLSSEEKKVAEPNASKDANSTQKEQQEVEKTAENYKKQNLHAFARMAGRVITNKMEQGGQMLTQTAINSVAADGGVAEGVSDLKKMASPIATAASLVGLAAMSSKYKNELKEFGKAGSTVDDLLSRFNPIGADKEVKLFANGNGSAIEEFSLEDLHLSKKALNKKLEKLGVSADIRKSIIKNRNDLHSMFIVRDEILHIASVRGIPDDLRKHLLSKNFFDMTNKKNVALLQMYFDNAPEDAIRNVLGHGKYQSMTKRDFKKFMKKFDANGVSEESRATVRISEIMVNGKMARMKFGSKLSSVIKGNFKKMVNSVIDEGGVADGAKDLSRATKATVTIGRFGKKVFIGTRRGGYRGLLTNAPTGKLIRKILFGTKKGGYKGVVTQIARFGIRTLKYADFMLLCMTNGKFNVMKTILLARKGLAKAGQATKQAAQAAGRAAQAAGRAAKQKAINVANNIAKTKVGQTTQRVYKASSDFIKKRMNEARKAAEKLAKTKAIRAAKKTAQAAAIAKKAAKKTLTSAIANFFSFGGRVKRILFIVALVVVLIASLLFVVIDGVLAILSLIIGVSSTTILPERDDFLKELNDRYQAKFEQVKESAIELGSSTNFNLQGLCGHTITRFGHPHVYEDPREYDASGHEIMTEEWSTGFRIYYRDKDGNLLYNINNNIKDVITLTYVQTDGDFDIKNEEDTIRIADEYFAYMNPQSVEFDADDIELTFYFCDKCETVYYKCSDRAICTKTDRIVEKQSDIIYQEQQGVHFRTPIVTHENGDYVVCKSHEAQTPDGCDDYITKYYHSKKTGCTNWRNGACEGHTVYVNGAQCEVTYRSSCRGHKGDRQCGKEEHKHSLDCYETVLACDIVDPKHVHVAGCFQKVQTCILEEHIHGSWMSPSNNGCYNTVYHGEVSGIASHGKMETPGACTNYDIYCTGHSVDACYGHYDSKIFITLLTKEDVYEDNFSVEQGLLNLRPGWKEDSIDWADTIYKQNWYDLYGFDPAGGLGFDTEEALTTDQISQIVDALETSQLRKDIVKAALSQVGSVPFYSGGKPLSGSVPIRTNVGYVGNRASFEDSSGNVYAGLDGFGFAEWAYWHAAGSDILPEGRTIRATEVFKGTNIGNLIPITEEELEVGDLGFQAGHCGIYCGIINEKPIWVHCKPGSVNIVTFEPYAGFTKFFRVNGI